MIKFQDRQSQRHCAVQETHETNENKNAFLAILCSQAYCKTFCLFGKKFNIIVYFLDWFYIYVIYISLTSWLIIYVIYMCVCSHNIYVCNMYQMYMCIDMYRYVYNFLQIQKLARLRLMWQV